MSKQKSEKRFEQLRYLVETVIPSFPKGRGKEPYKWAAVIYACWYFAKGREGEFNATKGQIAAAAGITESGVKKILSKLESGGVITTVKRGAGHFGSVRRFTWKPYSPPKAGGPQKDPLRVPRTSRGGPQNINCRSPEDPLSEQNIPSASVSLRETPAGIVQSK